MADEALIANWNACATVLREAPALKEVIGGKSPRWACARRERPASRRQLGSDVGGSAFHLGRAAAEAAEGCRGREEGGRPGGVPEEGGIGAESCDEKAAHVPNEEGGGRLAIVEGANALLENSEKALDLFPCDFQDWDRNAAECKIKWKGVQRALSTLAHAQRWVSLHDALLESGGLDGQPLGAADDAGGESPGIVANNRTAAQLEARAEAASLLSSGGGRRCSGSSMGGTTAWRTSRPRSSGRRFDSPSRSRSRI